MVHAFGLRVWVEGSQAEGLGLRVSGLRVGATGFRLRVWGYGFQAEGLGQRVQARGLGLRVSGLGVGATGSGLRMRREGVGVGVVFLGGFGFRV